MMTTTTNVVQTLEAIATGHMVLVVDDADREDEADLMIAADHVTPEAIAFMAFNGGGLVCVAMTGARLDELELDLMVPSSVNTALHGTAFTVSVDAVHDTKTGISAFDRAQTIRALVSVNTGPQDLARPGHVFPLRAHPSGVLGRRGQTEAGVDLARLAGCSPAAVICEVMVEDGTMARGAYLAQFASEHRLPLVTVEELVAHRRGLGD